MLLYSGFRDPITDEWVSTQRKRRWVRDPDTGVLVPQKIIQGGSNAQSWVTTRQSAQIAGTALTNTAATPTSILPTHAVYTLEPEFFNVPGIGIRITATGHISNVVTTPGTLTLDVRLGAVVAFNGGAMGMSTTVHTTLPFYSEILLTARAVGSGTSANLIGLGWIMGQPISFVQNADLATSNSIGSTVYPNVTPVVGTGFDSTASQAVNLFATFSVATVTTSIQLQQYMLEALL